VGALLLAMLLALAVRRLTPPSVAAAPCTGGENPKVEWRTTDPKPAFVAGHLFQIEPLSVPTIRLAEIHTTGNSTYGDKCDHEWGHIHDPVYVAVMNQGANAYFNNPMRQSGSDSVEVVVTAVLAHAGPIAQTIKDRYFPEARALMVVHIVPGSAAEEGALRPADLLAKVKGVALRAGRAYEIDAIPVTENEPIDVLVIRNGQEVTLSMVRHGRSKLGYSFGEVPILEAAP